ncbi:MAG: hypothetical protein A3B24_02120 [Candidatus Wildermuthbacteria bacterium RIFCSPLOWO2_01_FULL_48_16]|uniref:DUF2007 domain-containing protein n=1 Tax=Candidatus Wildermuthbacteria bacterium RIFCSPLOWO2_01_FULL_48_16 TaxID=1802461 RepID=A0A1G2RM66_9BACT|nr:MAG: hypothetical protein A3B24_02120 [Candidatus Wildermuthbacteria bacterium RIFCSPLOWO2_01_FULL_48_16]
MSETNEVCVKTFPSRQEAEVAKNLLLAHDIVCFVSADDGGGVQPWLLISTGGARLMVSEKDAETARQILASNEA